MTALMIVGGVFAFAAFLTPLGRFAVVVAVAAGVYYYGWDALIEHLR